MKRFRYTYYLLALVYITISSCTGDGIIKPDAEHNTQISLTMRLSGTRAEGSASDAYDYAKERYISDVAVYIFSKSDAFVEKLEKPFITGSDGDAVRTISGELKADYSPYTAGIDIIVLTNLAQRGITPPTLSRGQSKADLYSQLAYTYAPGDNWKFPANPKQYAPMWGTGSINTALKVGLNRGGNINLYRAVARVDVVFNEGNGFNHFIFESVKLTHCNDKGSCATDNLTVPYIPGNSSPIAEGANFFRPDASKAIYRLYIPEYKNNGQPESNICKVEIKGILITGSGSLAWKTYILEFRKEKEALQDILRNHLYRFNVTKITNEVAVTSTLDYEVEKWDFISINVPPFN